MTKIPFLCFVAKCGTSAVDPASHVMESQMKTRVTRKHHVHPRYKYSQIVRQKLASLWVFRFCSGLGAIETAPFEMRLSSDVFKRYHIMSYDSSRIKAALKKTFGINQN